MAKKYLVNGVEKDREELFNEEELKVIDHNQELVNDLGYGDIDITLLTQIEREVSQQKFYQIDPKLFVPFDTTQGGWSDFITVLRNYSNAEGNIADWERGVDSDNARRNQVSATLGAESLKIHNLAKMVSYSLFEMRSAMETGRWNIVTEKERARKRDYDLAVQKAVLHGDANFKGLLNQTGVVSNTTVLTKKISAMTSAEFRTFLSTVFKEYFANSGMTVLPDTLVIAPSDFLGLGAAVDEQYPLVQSMLTRAKEVFKEVTGNANADIKMLAYCEPDFNGGYYKYALYRRDFDTLRVYQPYDYNVVQGATVDGMNYQNTAYARLSDVFVNRPAEMLYLTWENQ